MAIISYFKLDKIPPISITINHLTQQPYNYNLKHITFTDKIFIKPQTPIIINTKLIRPHINFLIHFKFKKQKTLHKFFFNNC
jgi:hypothetical protein